MIDALIIIAHMWILPYAMRGKGQVKHPGDFIGWFFVCALLLCIVKIPIYLVSYGTRLPFNPSDVVVFSSGLISLAFWFTMLYYRVPYRIIQIANKR